MKHNSTAAPRSIRQLRRTWSAIFIVLSIVAAFAALGVQQGTSWTYQGQLRRGGAPYNGTCNFQFSLWDAASGGTQKVTTQSINGVSVVNGVFTVTLDFGEVSPIGERSDFTGEARWLATSVQCSGDGGFTPLDPRQPITAAPYALSLQPGATIIDETGTATLKVIQSGQHPAGFTGSALVAENEGNGYGVYASSADGSGVFGVTGNGTGVFGRSHGIGAAIFGQSLDTGLAGAFDGPVQITGPLTVNASGVAGVFGNTTNSSGSGVHGTAAGSNSAGVFGVNSTGAGIWGRSTGAGPAIFGENTGGGFAGRFKGPVLVEGNLIVQGTVQKAAGTFKIDHPLDPANKFLSHSFVESPDMMNVYNGNVTTDATGSATVTLPDYFEALNRDYRYQLTVLGQFAQAIVSRKVAQNSFEIRTDKPGVEVSWQVTGIRQDAYARENPVVVEEFKPAEQLGMYLYPAGFGAGEEKGIGSSSRPISAPEIEQKITKKTK